MSETSLTKSETNQLEQYEKTIERGMSTFVDVGTALLAIRDDKLYRKDYKTFETYCQERWEMSRPRAYQLMDAAEVARNLSTIVDNPPVAESQIRPLSPLTPEQQRDAWQLAIDTAPDGNVTAKHVEEAVATVTGKPHVSFNSGNNEWYTPLKYLDAATAVMGRIDLDPASSPEANKNVKADKFYSIDDSGLTHKWHGRVWMNPPYAGDLIGAFCSKLAEHIGSGEVTEAIVLVNNATETSWFGKLVGVSSAIVFPDSRVKFLDQQGNATGAPLQGQAIIYSGKNIKKFFDNFSKFGWMATL